MAPPSSPSYARSTAASDHRAYRASPKSEKLSGPNNQDGGPKKLKRPSALTGRDRQLALLLATQRNGLIITPADPEKPCPLAELPTEIREMIYECLLPEVSITIEGPERYNRSLWPALLRVSRRIRYEAAYVFYSQTEFEACVEQLDFSHVRSWIENLPIMHRVFLGRNRSLQINLLLGDRHYSPIISHKHWCSARRFGNVYSIFGAIHKHHFVSFSLLADWWLWCARPAHMELKWKYHFIYPDWWYYSRHYPEEDNLSYNALHFLKNELGAVALPCTQNSRIDEKQKNLMRGEAMNMLECVDSAFSELNRKDYYIADWNKRMTVLRRFLAKW